MLNSVRVDEKANVTAGELFIFSVIRVFSLKPKMSQAQICVFPSEGLPGEGASCLWCSGLQLVHDE